MPSQGQFGIAEAGLAVAGIVMTLILHEIVHGIMMSAFGAHPEYGVQWKKMMLYATCPGYAFRQNSYLAITLAPVVAISALTIAGLVVLSGTVWVGLAALCGAINGGGAIGDLWIALLVLRYPAKAYVVDERDGFRVFLPRETGKKRVGE